MFSLLIDNLKANEERITLPGLDRLTDTWFSNFCLVWSPSEQRTNSILVEKFEILRVFI